MLYRAYDARSMMLTPIFTAATLQSRMLRGLAPAGADVPSLRGLRAWAETVSALELSHERPEFGIDGVTVDGRGVAVEEEVVRSTDFGSLLRFSKAGRRQAAEDSRRARAGGAFRHARPTNGADAANRPRGVRR